MTKDFAIICKKCFDNRYAIVDDCHVHISDESTIMYKCMNCGNEEFISEKIRDIHKDRELLDAHKELSEYMKDRFHKKRKN